MAKKINLKELIAAGFRLGQLGFKDSSGFMGGINGTVASGGTASMHTWVGVKTANVQIPDDTTVAVTGDDTTLGTFSFSSNEPRSFEMTVGQLDLQIPNKAQGTNIYTVGSYYDMILGDVTDRDFTDALVWLTAEAQIKDSGKEGSGWYHLLFPNAQVSYLGTSLEEQGAVTQNYRVTVQPFTTTPWGLTVNASNFGKTQAHFLMWASERRMTMNTYKHDGAQTTFTLSRVPYTDSDSIIRLAGWRTNPNGAGGVEVTTSLSVVAATKVVTISSVSPFASGHYLTTIFEY